MNGGNGAGFTPMETKMAYYFVISTKSKTGRHNPAFCRLVEAVDYQAACDWLHNRYKNQVVIHYGGYPVA
jgi:hypothetical protein